jgi:hypothetical protein
VVDYFKQPGIDVMLTICLRYSPIFGRNNWRFLKKQCYDPIFANKTAVVLAKNALFGVLLQNQCHDPVFAKKLAVSSTKKSIFSPEKFGENIFKNHNFGPRYCGIRRSFGFGLWKCSIIRSQLCICYEHF